MIFRNYQINDSHFTTDLKNKKCCKRVTMVFSSIKVGDIKIIVLIISFFLLIQNLSNK